MAGAAMVLGLGCFSPLATVPHGCVRAERSPSTQALLRHGDGARVSQDSSLVLGYRNGKRHHRRKLRLLVHALNEEEADITSMRGKLHDENLLITLVKRLFDWGRDVQQQSTEQLQKFFHELADGSLLVSFGAASPSAAPKPQSLPLRLPSRFSKQLPYTLKGAKKQSESHLAKESAGENVPAQQSKKPPARVRSTFSKRSPIIKPSLKHLPHKDGLSSAVTGDLEASSSQIDPDHGAAILAFKDVCLQEETSVLMNSSESKRLRPRVAFVRKSPIPRTSKTRKRKAAEKKETFEQVSATDVSSAGNPTGHMEHKKALGRSREYGSSDEAASHVDKPHPPSKFSRPKAAFVRKSPITQARGGRRKRKPAKKDSFLPGNKEADEKNVVAGVMVETTTTFASKDLPVVESVMLQAAEKDHLIEEEIRKHAAEAVAENETEQKNVVAEVMVEESTVFVETLVQANELEEKSSKILEEIENGSAVSQNSVASKSRRRKVQTVETDVEASDDDSGVTDEDISDLSVLTLQRLRGIAKSRGLKGYSRLRKAELVELLSQS